MEKVGRTGEPTKLRRDDGKEKFTDNRLSSNQFPSKYYDSQMILDQAENVSCTCTYRE